MTALQDIKDEAKKFPGCRLVGTFENLMKVRAEVHINFRDHNAIYQVLSREADSRINLNYKLESLTFGDKLLQSEIIMRMESFHPEIREEIDPVSTDRPHKNGNFVVKNNLHIFPVEFKSDFSNRKINSYQYSIVKKFKAISHGSLESPDITFQLEFLPLTSVYHIKKISYRKLVISLLAVCGGVFSMMGLVNWFLSSGVLLVFNSFSK